MLYVCFRIVFHPVLYRTIMKTCVTHTVMKNIATMIFCIWAYVSQKKLINIPVGYERLTYQNIWENFRNSYNTVMKKKTKKKPQHLFCLLSDFTSYFEHMWLKKLINIHSCRLWMLQKHTRKFAYCNIDFVFHI